MGIYSSVFSNAKLDSLIQDFSSISLSSKWKIILDSNVVRYEYTDTMDLCIINDVSPIRRSGMKLLQTFKYEITFEDGWDKKRSDKTIQVNNKNK